MILLFKISCQKTILINSILTKMHFTKIFKLWLAAVNSSRNCFKNILHALFYTKINVINANINPNIINTKVILCGDLYRLQAETLNRFEGD